MAIRIAEATATIRDDDPLTVNVSGQNTVVAGQDATFTVELTGGNTGSQDVTVTYREGDSDPATVPIRAGSTTGEQRISISTTIDQTAPVVVTLLSATTSAGRVGIGTSRASTTVTDSSTVIISLSGLGNVPEGDPAQFMVTPEPASVSELTVVGYATTTGSASSADFEGKSGRLTFTSSDSAAKSVTLSTEEDTLAENDETFTVRVDAPAAGWQRGTRH